jgi:anti-sigma regulatory factor (Ser/Thr protein kinase)
MECDRLRLVAELIVPADVTLLTVCRMVLAGVGSGLPLSDQALDDLKLVLSEVCGAAMQRTGAAGGTVGIEFRTSQAEIEVSVSDRGGDAHRGGRGLGVSLLRRLCSRLDVVPRPDGPGRIVRFARTLPA